MYILKLHKSLMSFCNKSMYITLVILSSQCPSTLSPASEEEKKRPECGLNANMQVCADAALEISMIIIIIVNIKKLIWKSLSLTG